MEISDLNTTSANATATDMFNLLPIILLMYPFIWLYYKLFGLDVDEELEYSDVPEEILKQRFARGEIGVFEYTERMARL